MSTSRFGFETEGTDRLHTTDRRVMDALFAALELHDHSGGATPVALADPTAAPTAAVATAGGTLSNGQTLYYQVSFVDQFGLETAASDELAVALAATASSTEPPNPTGDVGGTLPAGTYYYALTVETAAGESALGPQAIITVAPDQNLVHVGLPALPAEATAFNVWRQNITDAGWTKVATGVTGANWNDNGVATGTCLTDPATQPPSGLVGIGTNAVTITVPDPGVVGVLPSDVKRWRLYRSTASGNYGDTALVAEVAVPGLDQPLPTTYVDTGAPLLLGAPLAISTTLRPSVAVADDDSGGGGGTGGATAANSYCAGASAAALSIPASGTAIPVRFASAGLSQLGHDVNLVGPVDTSTADELGIFTDGIYSPFAALTGSGFAAGDQVEVELVYEHAPSSPVPAPTKLTAVVRPDGTLDTGLVWPSLFLPQWTRLSLKVTPYYAGAPTDLAVQWGIAFVTGAPATDDVLPAVADLTTDTSTNDGNVGVTWTDVPGGLINDSYHFFVYGPDNAIVFQNSLSNAASADVATGLTDGVNYEVLVVGSTFMGGGTPVYGVAATTGFTGVVSADPVTDVVVSSDSSSITVDSWVAPAAGTSVASYNVTLLDAAGTTIVQGPTSVDAADPLTASFTGLTASTTYTVRVTAVSVGGGESTPVDTAESTTA